MPNISTFMYCDRAEPNPQGQLIITNPLLGINPVFVPGMFSFSIVFGVNGIDTDKDHTLRVIFSNESGETIIDSNILPLPKGQESTQPGLPDDLKGFMFNMDFRNVVFKNEGRYSTAIFIDGHKLGDYPIYVKVGETK